MIVALCYDLLFAVPLTLAVISLMHPQAARGGSASVPLALWLTAVILTLLCTALMKHLRMREKKWLIGILAALVCAVYFLIPAGEHISLLYRYRRLLLEMLLTVLLFFAGEMSVRHRRLRAVMALAAFGALPVLLIRHMPVTRLSVSMLLLYTLLVLADEWQRCQTREGDADPKKHLVFVSPFMLTVFVLSAFLSAPPEPYDWGFVKRLLQAVHSRAIVLGEQLFPVGGWDSDNPAIGFSGSGAIGGGFRRTDHTVFNLRPYLENDPCLYLGGRVFDVFDGTQWMSLAHDKSDERGLDTLETVSAVLACSGEMPVSDMIKGASFELEYRDIVTTSLFLPAKSIPVRETIKEKLLFEGAEIRFQKRRSLRKPVKLSYYRLNRNTPMFVSLLNSRQTVTRESWQAALQECGVSEEEGYRFEDYEAYHEGVYRYYLPETPISERMKAVMDECLAGAATEYEKLLRIQAMLADLDYTDHPGKLPEGLADAADYLDYFVLEKRAGYCSHFATAFVLLARAYGIPARYVQGFRVPMRKGPEITVSALTAHAWPEAYLDGIGWFTWEPTPGYYVSSGWLTEAEEEARSAGEEGSAAPERTVTEYAAEHPPEEVIQEEPRFALHWYQIVVPVLIGALLILLLYGMDILIRRRLYSRLDERGKCLALSRMTQELLKRRGMGRRREETLAEYSERIGQSLPCELLSFCAVCEKLLYGEKEASEADRLLLEKNHRELKRLLRGHKGRRILLTQHGDSLL